MPRIFEVVTPEQVAIQYELAGVGSRMVAALLDLLLLALINLPVDYVLIQAIVHSEGNAQNAYLGLLFLSSFVVILCYYVAFETLWSGMTPGKRVMGLRVIKDGGYPVDFRSVLIRNLVRIVDMMPGGGGIALYSVGFLSVMLHKQYKRLGDMAAGTLVVRHGQAEEENTFLMGEAVVFRLLDPATLTQISRLSRDDYRTVQRFLERRNDLPQPLRNEFARRLAEPLIARLDYRTPDLGMDYQRWLEELEMAYRQRAHGATFTAPTPTPATPTPETPPLPANPIEPAPPSDTRKW